jgi:hypothetical protein
MTPRSFDIDTCKEVVGDARMRVIEAKARQDADNGVMDAPAMAKGTYWGVVYSIMEITVYVAAYEKRLARIQRMKERA